MSRSRTITPGLVGMIVFGLATSCSRKETGNGRPVDAKPDVLLITFDTVRADHLGPYGHARAFTPALDALAKEAVKFNRAFSPVPITLPAHTTIMTGLYPFYHGVRDNSHFVVDPGLNTLAEALQQNGYQTAAVVAAFVLNAQFGLNQGFDTYDDEVRPKSEFTTFAVPERNAAAVTDAAIEWLKSTDQARPFFLWVHYYDPHSLYHAPDSFNRYNGHPYDVEIAYADTELGRLFMHLRNFTAAGRQIMVVFTADHGEALGQYGEPTHAYFAYDSTLHVPLMIRLPDESHAGREIDVPVTLADVMPTILDVLGLSVPGPDEIHGRSLTPLIESEQPPVDLVERPIAFECYEAYYGHGWAPIQGVRVGDVKFIDSPVPELYVLSENPKEGRATNRYAQTPKRAAALEAAYHDLFEGQMSFAPYTKSPQTPDPHVIEQLRALGYVAAPVSGEPEDVPRKDLKEMLPVYRRIMGAMSLISQGAYHKAVATLIDLVEGEPDDGRVLWLLTELAAGVPSVADESLHAISGFLERGRVPPAMVPQVLVNRGRIYLHKGDQARALDDFGEAARIQADYAGAYWWMGLAHLQLNRLAEAAHVLRRAAELYGPDMDRAHAVLGCALFADGQAAEGIAAWSKVLDKDSSPRAVWRIISACPSERLIAENVAPALERYADDDALPPRTRAALGIIGANYLTLLGRHESAWRVAESVRPLFPNDDGSLQLALARIHRRLGRTSAARELLEAAHRGAPDRMDIVVALAGLLEETGDLGGAAKTLGAYYEAHPDNLMAANNLAWITARQGQDLDRALKLAKRANARLPGNASVNDTLGWIYHLRGDREMAVRLLRRACQLKPENASYHYHLGEAYRKMGQAELAREAFTTAVRLNPTPSPEWYEEARKRAQEPEGQP